MKSVEIIVSGKVQGVFFRASTLREAKALGITGTVRNQRDGSVLIQATGNQSALDELITWCHTGSSAAQVEAVSIKDIPLLETPEKTFVISK